MYCEPVMSDYVSNKQIFKEFTQTGSAMLRDQNRYFVERDGAGGWKPVEPTDRFVPADELGKNFGLWKDEEITTGHLWWKDTVRPLDGQVQADEVVTMAAVLKNVHDSPVPGSIYPNLAYRDYDRLLSNSTELTITKDGANLHTDWQTLSRNCLHSLSVASNSYLV